MIKKLLIAAALVFATCLPARATQVFLPSTYVNSQTCALPPAMNCEIELTSLAINDTIVNTGDPRFIMFSVELNNTFNQNPTQSPPLQVSLRVLVDGTDSHTSQVTPAAGINSIQIPFNLVGQSLGAHTYQFFVAENLGPLTYTTGTYSAVLALNVANTSVNGTAGGDLSGTYPNPTVSKVNGNTPGGTCTAQFVRSLNSSAVPACSTVSLPADVSGVLPPTSVPVLSGDVTAPGGSATTTLASVVSPGSCGDATHSCGLTFDAKGRATAITDTAISGGGSSLEVKETDGNPDVTGVSIIQVSPGTLTNNGGGNVTVITDGGGGGSAITRLMSATGAIAVDTGNVGYMPVSGLGYKTSMSGSFSDVAVSVGIAGTIRKLHCDLDTAPTGTSKSWTFELDGSSGTLTCTITDAATSCDDLSNTATFIATDQAFLVLTPLNTPSASVAHCSATFTPS